MTTNSTDTYWDVDGTSLQTLAWNIRTWGGDRQKPPEFRGDDVEVPLRAGRVFAPKVPDRRVVSLDMWVIGADEDGDIVDADQFRTNLAALRALLWTPRRQVELTKRWIDEVGDLVSAVGLAQFNGGLSPDMTGEGRATFSVDLMMADPYFYGESDTIGPLTVGSHDVTGVIDGDVGSPRYTIKLIGPLTNPSVVVQVGGNTVSGMAYAGSVASGKYIQVAFPNLVVTKDDTAAKVTNFGTYQQPWVDLDPAATSIVVGGSGAGSVELSYEAAWL